MTGLLAILVAQQGLDVVKLVLVVIVLVIVLLGRLVSKFQGDPREAARRGRGMPPPGRPSRRDPLADEISEFLQQTAQRQGGQRPSGQPAGPSAPAGGRNPPPARGNPPSPPPAQPAQVSLEEHVRRYLDTAAIAQETAELGKEVVQADEKMEKHVREAFSHRLGQLPTTSGEGAGASGTGEPAPPPPLPKTTARGLAALLRNPATVRQAILISEILNRPEHRWS
jgi:hypothetical protein